MKRTAARLVSVLSLALLMGGLVGCASSDPGADPDARPASPELESPERRPQSPTNDRNQERDADPSWLVNAPAPALVFAPPVTRDGWSPMFERTSRRAAAYVAQPSITTTVLVQRTDDRFRDDGYSRFERRTRQYTVNVSSR